MKKYVIILLCVGLLFSSYCWSQEFPDPIPKVPKNQVHKRVIENSTPRIRSNEDSLITVIFNTTNDTCYLKIDEKDYGKIFKGSPREIELHIGTYKLSFESANTGQTISPPDFKLSKDMGKDDGNYIYPAITFPTSTAKSEIHYIQYLMALRCN